MKIGVIVADISGNLYLSLELCSSFSFGVVTSPFAQMYRVPYSHTKSSPPPLPPYMQAQYSGLNNSVISYGPCQTPTLGFCVQRHDEIQRFTSEKFWKLALKVTQSSGTSRHFHI